MSSTGFDWGLGVTNIDTKTGIRFGIIPANHEELADWFWDSFEPEYGDPACPKCGDPVVESFDKDYRCERCDLSFWSDDCFPDEPISNVCTDPDYAAFVDDSNDVWITKSPYFTRAAFCSPCAPGACYLTDARDDGERAYCLGHDWFECGRAPYPVYRVSDGSLVEPDADFRVEGRQDVR